ncbi:MAG: phosphatase PAP2 family protein [Erysipelotrichaceae bacterium]|nr:phosphatase PAP2 family protein [Erysipelotrichaceae bacterium]
MAAWLNTFFGDFDYAILEFFHKLMVNYGTVLEPVCKVLDIIGDIPFLLIGWLGFILFLVKKDKKTGMMMCGSIIIGAILVTFVLKMIIYRARPYLSEVAVYKQWWDVLGLKADWDTSFPSGHSCAAMAGCLAYFACSDRRFPKALVFLYPLIMGVSRICLVVHYPSDVLAGYLVGVISTLICVPFVIMFYKLFSKYPDFPLSRFVLTGKWKKEKNATM